MVCRTSRDAKSWLIPVHISDPAVERRNERILGGFAGVAQGAKDSKL